MTRLDDVRRTFEAAVGNVTPQRAQELAKSFEPGAAKEQVAKAAADILEWSQRNRERMSSFIRGEVQNQMAQTGVATRDELDALKKRVRDLERAAGMTASGRKASAAKKSAAKRSTTRSKAKRPAAGGSASGSSGGPPALGSSTAGTS